MLVLVGRASKGLRSFAGCSCDCESREQIKNGKRPRSSHSGAFLVYQHFKVPNLARNANQQRKGQKWPRKSPKETLSRYLCTA
jgi:hypothetical protein